MNESATNRDAIEWEEIRGWVCDPSKINQMNADEVLSRIQKCVSCIERVRMGGRSASIFAISALLWYGKGKVNKQQIDVEKLMSLALHIVTDPSFVQPEMGIILAGVLVARYSDWLSDDCREEILSQTKLMLNYFATQDSYPNQVRSVAWALTTSWELDFEVGIQESISIMKSGWPETTSMQSILGNHDRLNRLFEDMRKEELPASVGHWGKSLYRLYFERGGLWEIIESFKLE
jgi:hypothetical protein